MRKKYQEEVSLFSEPDEQNISKAVEITGYSVYVRSAPGMNASIFGAVPAGTKLEWIDTAPDSDGTDWHEVYFDGKHGYVCGKYSRLVG